MNLGWCEKGYPEWFFGKDRGYGLGAAPHLHSREINDTTLRKVAELATRLSDAQPRRSSAALDADEVDLDR